jgi:hypothetical protein
MGADVVVVYCESSLPLQPAECELLRGLLNQRVALGRGGRALAPQAQYVEPWSSDVKSHTPPPARPSGLKWQNVGPTKPAPGRELDHPQLSKALDGTSGLKWQFAGTSKPATGQELIEPRLEKALSRKTELTQKEWDAVGIHNLSTDHFIKSGDSYFKPAEKTKFTQQEWDGFGITNLRMDHFVKRGDNYFKPDAPAPFTICGALPTRSGRLGRVDGSSSAEAAAARQKSPRELARCRTRASSGPVLSIMPAIEQPNQSGGHFDAAHRRRAAGGSRAFKMSILGTGVARLVCRWIKTGKILPRWPGARDEIDIDIRFRLLCEPHSLCYRPPAESQGLNAALVSGGSHQNAESVKVKAPNGGSRPRPGALDMTLRRDAHVGRQGLSQYSTHQKWGSDDAIRADEISAEQGRGMADIKLRLRQLGAQLECSVSEDK